MAEQLKPCAHCGGEAYRANSAVIRCRSCPVELFDRANAAAAWNRRATPWIPVTERLPADEFLVLVARRDGQVHHAACMHGVWFYNKRPLADQREVTHWQPLPAPPSL